MGSRKGNSLAKRLNSPLLKNKGGAYRALPLFLFNSNVVCHMSNEQEKAITQRLRDRITPQTKRYVSINVTLTQRIWEAMEKNDVSVTQLADKLSLPVEDVEDMLTGMNNLTLRDIANIEVAIGQNVIA
jgi:hypothetical protein